MLAGHNAGCRGIVGVLTGYQPVSSWGRSGYDVDNFFGSTTFSGSHENSVKMLYDGQFDAVATWWTNEKKSNMSRMENKGMIEPGQYRIIWKSPRLPSNAFTVPAWLPQDMQEDIKNVLLNFHEQDPAAFAAFEQSFVQQQRVKRKQQFVFGLLFVLACLASA